MKLRITRSPVLSNGHDQIDVATFCRHRFNLVIFVLVTTVDIASNYLTVSFFFFMDSDDKDYLD